MSALVSAADFKSDESIAGYALGSSILSSSRRLDYGMPITDFWAGKSRKMPTLSKRLA